MRRSRPEMVWTARERIRIRREKHCYFLWFMSFFFCLWRDSPPVGHGLLIHEVSRSHSTTHHSRQDSSIRVISPTHRPLPDNTRHSQQTNIHVPGGIRTHNLRRRAAVDLRLRSRGHWDRLMSFLRPEIKHIFWSIMVWGVGRTARVEDFGKWGVTWEVANSTIMRKWKWRLDGIDTSLCPRVCIWN